MFLSLSLRSQKKKINSAAAGTAAAAGAPRPAPTSTKNNGDNDISNGNNKIVVITEGRASISQRAHEVFYNPVQVVNRDLSVACLRVFAARRQAEFASGKARKAPRSGREDNGGDKRKQQQSKRKQQQQQEEEEEGDPEQGGGNDGSNGRSTSDGIAAPPPRKPAAAGTPGGGLRVLEGLAATGLRALRYALEIEAVDSVHAVDLDPSAVAAMRRNVALNAAADESSKKADDVEDDGGGANENTAAAADNPTSSSTSPPRAHKVHPSQGDARLVMLANANCYDVVDLDPYGSPAILLDAAVRAVSHGGKVFSFVL